MEENDKRTLVLVKHAEPIVDPGVPPNRWRLSANGRRQSVVLAERLNSYAPGVIVASEEPKASETGSLVAEHLGVVLEPFLGLHEHDRTGVPFGTQTEFEQAARQFFENPKELVWGNESAEQATERFAKAIDEVLERHSNHSLVVVTHGTVISLLLSQRSGVNGYEHWRKLGLPSFCVLTVPGFELRQTVIHLADH